MQKQRKLGCTIFVAVVAALVFVAVAIPVGCSMLAVGGAGLVLTADEVRREAEAKRAEAQAKAAASAQAPETTAVAPEAPTPAPAPAVRAPARTYPSRVWTLRAGGEIEGAFAGYDGLHVLLSAGPGQPMRVLKSDLSAADLRWLQENVP